MSSLKKTPPWRALVFPGGTEIGLEINRALRDCKDVVLYSAGQTVPSAAEFRFSRHMSLPRVDDPHCLEALRVAIAAHQIDLVFPAHDDVVLALATAGAATIGATVITSPAATCTICRFKSLTYQALEAVVPVPHRFATVEECVFPVFVKPDRGQGSVRARRIGDPETLRLALREEPDLIVSEYLPGDEFTIDCFSDRTSGLLFHSTRLRMRIRAGIAMQSRLVKDQRLSAMAHAIGAALDLRGAWFFQAKENATGEVKLLEVAPRISGTMALSRVLGVNFPLLSIFEAAGHSLAITAFDGAIEIRRSLDNHYLNDQKYSAVYIDLDDTLILRQAVNTRLIRFVFQCINRGIPIRLLTRHAGDLSLSLRRYRLDGIFDEVIHVSDAQSKCDAIREADAIFIDDSFRERRLVAQTCGIRTFDPSAVECLIDDRD